MRNTLLALESKKLELEKIIEHQTMQVQSCELDANGTITVKRIQNTF